MEARRCCTFFSSSGRLRRVGVILKCFTKPNWSSPRKCKTLVTSPSIPQSTRDLPLTPGPWQWTSTHPTKSSDGPVATLLHSLTLLASSLFSHDQCVEPSWRVNSLEETSTTSQGTIETLEEGHAHLLTTQNCSSVRNETPSDTLLSWPVADPADEKQCNVSGYRVPCVGKTPVIGSHAECFATAQESAANANLLHHVKKTCSTLLRQSSSDSARARKCIEHFSSAKQHLLFDESKRHVTKRNLAAVPRRQKRRCRKHGKAPFRAASRARAENGG